MVRSPSVESRKASGKSGKRGSGSAMSLPRQRDPVLVPANDTDQEPTDETVAKNATMGDTAASTPTKREGLDSDEDKVTDDLGPAEIRQAGSGYMPLYFSLSARDNEQLEAIAEKRGEVLAVLNRKILEHKILNDPEAPIDTSRVKVRVSVSEEMRERIDQSISATGMKRSEFIALQISAYLAELRDQDASPQP